MRSFQMLLAVFCVGVYAVLVSAAPASATLITNTTTTLFGDDFEGVSNISNAAYPDASGDYDPTGGTPGSWTITESSLENVQVTDYGTPGSYEGSNYLRLVRPTDGNAAAQANFATQSSGSAVHMETMLRIGDTSTIEGSLAGQIVGQASGIYPINIGVGLNGQGHKVMAYYNWGWNDTGLSYVPDTWQKWQIDWTVATGTFTLTLDDAAANVAVDVNSGYGALSNFWFGMGPGSTMYIDAVPEPSTMVLLAAGVVGLLAYAWRRRR